MKHYTKNDCDSEVTLDELKSELLRMMDILSEYSKSNGIKYCLSGGTLLGAIRHKGFIPWDDDIDVNIPRPDCEKLMQVSKGQINSLKLVCPNYDKTYGKFFYRLYSDRILIEDFDGGFMKNPRYIPAFIDIFPIEGLSELGKQRAKDYGKLAYNYRLMNCLNLGFFEGKNTISKVVYTAMKPIAYAIGRKRIFNSCQKVFFSNDFEKSKYIGVMSAQCHKLEEVILKENYYPLINVSFEGRNFNAPQGYNEYLTNLYGADYMKLPPKEKQKSHHKFHIYTMKKNQEE